MLAQFLAFFGVSLGAVLIMGLLVRRDANRRANGLLAAAIVSASAYLVAPALVRAGLNDLQTLNTALAYSFFLGPPLLYGYMRELVSPSGEARPIWPHLILPAGLLLLAVSGLVGGMAFNADNLAQARGGWPPSALSVVSILMYGVAGAYMLACLAVLHRHQMVVADLFSYQEKVTLNWLRVLAMAYLLLAMLGLILALVRVLPGVDLWPRSYYSVLMLIGVNYVIAFIGMSQPAVFASVESAPSSAADTVDSPAVEGTVGARYETSALTPEMSAAYWETIQNCMTRDQPHLDNSLRVADLARRTGIPAHHLSQTINQHAGKNFFHFINDYRVKTAQALLQAGELPLKAITFDAGFNSQSAFYRHFKQVTGMTPRQYQQRVIPESPAVGAPVEQ